MPQSIGKSPEFYEYYPELFSSFYKNVDSKTVKELSLAGYLYYQSVLSADSVIDNNDNSKIFHVLSYQEEAIKRLTYLFGKDSQFWDYWNARKKEYQQAVILEKKFSKKDSVSFNQYKDLADYKSTFGKVAIDSMHFLSDSENNELYQALLKSHYYFSAGFQLYDDVKDFYEDIQKGQFNWAVYQLYSSLNENEKKLPPQILSKLLFIRGIGQKILQLSIQQFRKAKEIVKEYRINSLWEKTIQEMEDTISGYLDETHGYLLILEKTIELENTPENKNTFFSYSHIKEETIRKGLSFIEKDYRKNYAELQHIMYLSRKQGFSVSSPIQASDVFQRALLNDCLFHIAEKHKLDISGYLEKEVEYLVGKRRKDIVGAWSYYPEIKEIASDIDDLGQIIQLFIHSGRTDLIKKYCKKPIDIVLQNRVKPNGGIETWIIPKDKQTKIQQKQELYNQTKWGTGPDVEVVANFIYALTLLRDSQNDNYISHALNYMVKEQQEKGCWIARWYYGNYYGTYVALRLLSHYQNDFTKSIKSALSFIIQNQNKDGGWGKDTDSDALNTALALLSLKLFNKKEHSRAIIAGERYLIHFQNASGEWDSTDFIKPKASQPYKSTVLTTAFVLKVLSV